MAISQIFQDLLQSRRAAFNQSFELAKWEHPTLDSQGFLQLLEKILDPLVVALAAEAHSDRLPEIVENLYDLLLDLYTQNLIDHQRRKNWIQKGWEQLLPALAPQMAAQAAACSNALFHLENAPTGDPQRWMDGMMALAATTKDADQLLEAGQVLGWRCGMAQYRQGALALAASLPERQLRLIFDLPANTPPAEALRRMQGDAFWNPQIKDTPPLKRIGWVGAFTGFGGVFETPPRVLTDKGRLLTQDGSRTWQVFADSFGVAFAEIPKPEFDKQPEKADLEMEAPQMLRFRNHRIQVAGLYQISSSAIVQHTLAITQPLSHQILLIHFA